MVRTEMIYPLHDTIPIAILVPNSIFFGHHTFYRKNKLYDESYSQSVTCLSFTITTLNPNVSTPLIGKMRVSYELSVYNEQFRYFFESFQP